MMDETMSKLTLTCCWKCKWNLDSSHNDEFLRIVSVEEPVKVFWYQVMGEGALCIVLYLNVLHMLNSHAKF